MQRSAGNQAVARLLAGADLQVGQSSKVQRELTGNPNDIPQTPASPGVPGQAGTTHAAPTLDDAQRPPGAPGSAAAAPVGRSTPDKAVRIRATESAPLEAETVAPGDLYTEEIMPTTSAAGGPDVVNAQLGDTTAPIVSETADESLFIDPGPTAADVQQGGIGDCWDMATFISIVNRDPNKIRSMMAPDGRGGATVSFYRRQSTPSGAICQFFGVGPTVEYVAESVKVTNELAFDRTMGGAPGARASRGGGSKGFQLHGAQLHAGAKPKSTKWYAKNVRGTLEVHRIDTYQMARWAPLMEKAAARFSQNFGQYGRAGDASVGEKSTPQGYGNISGGYPGYTLGMFYGQAGEYVDGGQGGFDNTAWTPGQGAGPLLAANAAAFDRLLLLHGKGRSYTPGQTQADMVTARGIGGDTGDAIYIPRLLSAIVAAQGAADWTNVAAATQTAITQTQAAIVAWLAATPDPSPMPAAGPPAGSKSFTKNALVTAARAAANPSANPTLVDATRSGPIKAMVDLLLIIKNMPVDWSVGNRSIYSGHEYSVMSVDIKMIPGAPMHVGTAPGFMRSMLYPFVDVPNSTVTLRNPHHGNEPDAAGTGPADGKDDGEFVVDLERCFRLFGAIMSASFSTTAAP